MLHHYYVELRRTPSAFNASDASWRDGGRVLCHGLFARRGWRIIVERRGRAAAGRTPDDAGLLHGPIRTRQAAYRPISELAQSRLAGRPQSQRGGISKRVARWL